MPVAKLKPFPLPREPLSYDQSRRLKEVKTVWLRAYLSALNAKRAPKTCATLADAAVVHFQSRFRF